MTFPLHVFQATGCHLSSIRICCKCHLYSSSLCSPACSNSSLCIFCTPCHPSLCFCRLHRLDKSLSELGIFALFPVRVRLSIISFCRCPDWFWSDGVPPYAQLILPSLVPTQRYDVSVNLLLPASQSNLALGNFMTTLTLSTLANKTITSVRRPVIELAVLSRSLLTTLNRQSPSPHVRPSFSQIQTLFVSRYPCYHHLLPVPLLWQQLLK